MRANGSDISYYLHLRQLSHLMALAWLYSAALPGRGGLLACHGIVTRYASCITLTTKYLMAARGAKNAALVTRRKKWGQR